MNEWNVADQPGNWTEHLGHILIALDQQQMEVCGAKYKNNMIFKMLNDQN